MNRGRTLLRRLLDLFPLTAPCRLWELLDRRELLARLRGLLPGPEVWPGRPRRVPRLLLEALEDRWLPSLFLVTDTSDSATDPNSLRFALTNLAAGSNTIDFAIGTTGSTQTINITSPLPQIKQQVDILGFTQGGVGYSGPPLIVLNGAAAGGTADGLDFEAGSSGSEVQGLVIQQFGLDGLLFNGTSGNLVVGNYLGTSASGTAALGNQSGVVLEGGATANTIGGTGSNANVISGNSQAGVFLTGSGTSGNLVLGNLIGTDKNGTAALGNGGAGVLLGSSAAANTIGGATANIISGNGIGVELQGPVTANVVSGNLIGTDKSGTAPLGNNVGIQVDSSSQTLGPTSLVALNTIEANAAEVELSATASGTLVQGLRLGTNAAGTAALALPNGTGLVILSAHNTVGGTSAADANVISGGNAYGVDLQGAGASGNLILGNFIGTDVHGTAKIGNVSAGVDIVGANDNTVGGTAGGAGNVLSANGEGVWLRGGASGNVLQGNFIGTNKGGTANLGNITDGVILDAGASQNTVGGTATGAGNVIAFNNVGVELDGNTTVQDSVLGNSIYANTNLGINLSLGANHGQNAPKLASCSSTSRGTTIKGSLTSTPGTYRIEFFASPAGGSSAQGKTFLGFAVVKVRGSGPQAFTATGLGHVPAGWVVTATATNITSGPDFGDTSAFSAALRRS